MKAINKNYTKFIKSRPKLVHFLAFYKSLFRWHNRQKRKFYELYNQGKFEEAISFGEKALRKRKNNYHLRRMLAKAYRNLGHHHIAAIKLSEDLSITFGQDVKSIEAQIEKEIFGNSGVLRVRSKFIYLGGMNNYGQVQHEIIDENISKEYITKISTPEKIKREYYFYSKICEENPKLKSVTANLLGYFESDNREMAFLTIDKITGNSAGLEHLQKVISAHKVLSLVTHNLGEIGLNTPNKKVFAKSNYKTIVSPTTFSGVHLEEVNKIIFKWLHEKILNHKYKCTGKSILSKLESIIIKDKFYEKIIPCRHFSLVHGDFGRHNILVDEKSEKIYIIDWSGYFFGPATFDMTRLFESFFLDFNSIKKIYIDKIINEDCKNSIIEVSIFTYMLIISWFKEKSIARTLENHNDYLVPAIDYLEYLISKLV